MVVVVMMVVVSVFIFKYLTANETRNITTWNMLIV
jgi:hypothetical protein